jgi:hypothetical protein
MKWHSSHTWPYTRRDKIHIFIKFDPPLELRLNFLKLGKYLLLQLCSLHTRFFFAFTQTSRVSSLKTVFRVNRFPVPFSPIPYNVYLVPPESAKPSPVNNLDTSAFRMKTKPPHKGPAHAKEKRVEIWESTGSRLQYLSSRWVGTGSRPQGGYNY